MSFQFRHIWLGEFVKLCHVPLYKFVWSTLIEDNLNWLIEKWNFSIVIWLARLAKLSYPLFCVDGSRLQNGKILDIYINIKKKKKFVIAYWRQPDTNGGGWPPETWDISGVVVVLQIV